MITVSTAIWINSQGRMGIDYLKKNKKMDISGNNHSIKHHLKR